MCRAEATIALKTQGGTAENFKSVVKVNENSESEKITILTTGTSLCWFQTAPKL